MPLADDVQSILGLGLKIFPIYYKSKRPMIKRWPERASSDITEARELFKSVLTPEQPLFNYGVVPGDDVVIIDIDLMPADWVDPPRTFRVRTGRECGGEHWYFTTDRPVKSGPIYPGLVDAKSGKRSYVLGPGSVHDKTGRTYEIIDSSPIAPAPPWVKELLARTRRYGSTEDRPTLPLPNGEIIENEIILVGIRSSLNIIDPTPGNRNNSFFKFVASIYEAYGNKEITAHTAEDMISEGLALLSRTGDFTDDEAQRTIDSAFRTVFGLEPSDSGV